MWGCGTYLMRLAYYVYGRRGRKKCDVCGKKFDIVDEMEMHRRDLHLGCSLVSYRRKTRPARTTVGLFNRLP